MDYKNENCIDTETGSKRTKIISRLESLRNKIRSLQENMQRERTLIDYHMQAHSYHAVRNCFTENCDKNSSVVLFQLNRPKQNLYERRYSYYQTPLSYRQQSMKGAYERHLDDVMQMCHFEEERLQKSMYDLRKVRKYWRDIDLDHQESDEKGCLNKRINVSENNATSTHSKIHPCDNYFY